MAKSFSLVWAYEPFERHSTFFTKPMFGGLAVYLFGRMVMVIMESPGEKQYRDKKFSFDLWNGLLLPMERSSHVELQKEFPDLISHPVLGKWLYLPMASAHFEHHAERIAQYIKNDDMRFGVYPKPKIKRNNLRTRNKTSSKKSTIKKIKRKKSVRVSKKK